jgi:hypothetical protein
MARLSIDELIDSIGFFPGGKVGDIPKAFTRKAFAAKLGGEEWDYAKYNLTEVKKRARERALAEKYAPKEAGVLVTGFRGEVLTDESRAQLVAMLESAGYNIA